MNEKKQGESVKDKHGSVFTIGAGAHYGGNGDSYPITITQIGHSGRRITAQKDRYRRIPNGQPDYVDGPQDCEFSRDTQGQVLEFTWRRKSEVFQLKGAEEGWGILYAERVYARNPQI